MTEPKTRLSRHIMLRILIAIQNSDKNFQRDIITITGLMDDDEIATHLMANFKALPQLRQTEVLSLARRIAN